MKAFGSFRFLSILVRNRTATKLTPLVLLPLHLPSNPISRFVDNNYHELKKLNPQTAFLMRPSVGLASARILATYGTQRNGQHVDLDRARLSSPSIHPLFFLLV
jgi:hypothetical protein